MLVLMTRRSRELIDHAKSLDLATIDAQLSRSKHVDELKKIRYVRKPLQPSVHENMNDLLFRRMLQFKFTML